MPLQEFQERLAVVRREMKKQGINTLLAYGHAYNEYGNSCYLTNYQMRLPRGTLVLKSTLASHPTVDLAPLVIHEIQVVGSRCGPFPPALRALESGTIDVAPLVSDRLPLADGAEAFHRAARPGALKVLIEVGA